jgi:hypothetical protein
MNNFLHAYYDTVKDNFLLAGVDPARINPAKLQAYCEARYRDTDLILHSNVKQVDYEVTTSKLVDLILFSKSKPIITAYNTLFHNHSKVNNVPGGFLDYLKTSRSAAKKESHKHINDLNKTMFNSFDTLQRILKLIANSYYGAFGQKGFHFYNPLLGPSVTAQGRQLISSAILGFEGFMGDNITYETFDELVTFMRYVVKEEFNEEMVVEAPYIITVEMVETRLFSKAEFEITDTHREYVNIILESLNETQLQKMFYKNNLFEFLEVADIKDAITENLVRNDFPDAGKPPTEIKEILEELHVYIRYFVGYPYPYSKKTTKASKMIRKVVLVCDTDSNFLHVYPWLEYVCNNAGIDIANIDLMQRVSIISCMTYFITQFIGEVFNILCGNANVPPSEFHRINMKSEFHFKRVILTKNKKSYAGVILSKEGTVYTKPKYDIKGIQIKKVSTPKVARAFFTKLLEEKMLSAPTIDIAGVYKEYSEFAATIHESVSDGKMDYAKPGVLKIIKSYKMPFQMQPVRASMVWNAIYPNEYIPQSSTFKILDLNTNIIPPGQIPSGEKDVDGKAIMDPNPEFFEFLENSFSKEISVPLIDLFNSSAEMLQYGLTHIAIPHSVPTVPDELLHLIDVGIITNNVLSKGNILLESLGFVVVKSRKRQFVSNMIRV